MIVELFRDNIHKINSSEHVVGLELFESVYLMYATLLPGTDTTPGDLTEGHLDDLVTFWSR